MTVRGVPQFERFFRAAASLDVDKDDHERFDDFVLQKVCDLLIVGEAAAKANRRDIIEFRDLPITKGLQERIHEFERIDREADIGPILERFLPRPQFELAMSDDTERRLPGVAGGLSVALARSFKLVDPKVKNPATKHWERAFRLFDLVM
jgi:hypothetical protein